jgi:hypothetical protein
VGFNGKEALTNFEGSRKNLAERKRKNRKDGKID